eukprot:sb/3475412/
MPNTHYISATPDARLRLPLRQDLPKGTSHHDPNDNPDRIRYLPGIPDCGPRDDAEAAGEALLETEDTTPAAGQDSRSALFSRGSTRTLGTVRAGKTAPPPVGGIAPALSPQPTRPAFSRVSRTGIGI